MKSDVDKELDKIGRKVTITAKKLALPNRDTGALNNSFRFTRTYISEDKFNISIQEMYYGKYLNAKTHYMDKAIETALNENLSSLINILSKEVINSIIEKK